MAADLTTPGDVETALLRPFTDDEERLMPALIKQASSRLRTRVPAVDARISRFTTDPTDETALDPDVVSSVLAGVIARYVSNPQGATSVSKSRTDGPFSNTETTAYASYGKTLTGSNAAGLSITDDDLQQLTPVSSNVPRSIHTPAALAPGRLERSLRHGYPATG